MHYETEDIPEAKFNYDISPMSVVISSKRRAWCVRLCWGYSCHRMIDLTMCVAGLTDWPIPFSPHPDRYEFVTSLMAIIGGTFTVLGLVDGLLHKVGWVLATTSYVRARPFLYLNIHAHTHTTNQK